VTGRARMYREESFVFGQVSQHIWIIGRSHSMVDASDTKVLYRRFDPGCRAFFATVHCESLHAVITRFLVHTCILLRCR
jgi:hypothetical protein